MTPTTDFELTMTGRDHGHKFSTVSAPRDKRNNASLRTVATLLLFLAGTLTAPSHRAFAQPSPSPTNARSLPAGGARDGQHDFDFNVGVWHTHIQRILDPFSGTGDSIELNGTVTVRKVWGGRAQLEEIEADGPKGHWEGLTLFLYNPHSHQGSQSFINSKIASLSAPLVGEFHDGRAELFSQDTFHGRAILVRGVWSDITADAHRYEESYSNDGGKTWAAAFIANLARDSSSAPSEIAAGAEPRDATPEGFEFDFDFGAWKSHSSRLLHPLSGSPTWADLDGITIVHKVWNGRANLAEYTADGPAGHVDLLGLRWFNPNTHQWNLDFATPGVGMLGVPGIGEFKNGRAAFYDQEQFNGRYVLVRFSIWRTGENSAQSEQAFSDDGGKTWETNWVNKYTRIKN